MLSRAVTTARAATSSRPCLRVAASRCLSPTSYTAASSSSSSSSSTPKWDNPTLASLESRGLLAGTSSRLIDEHLSQPSSAPRSIYLGIDPTAPSLHVGHLIPLLTLLHLVHHGGHRGILLVGGATASIGDPTGKNAARPDLDGDALRGNVEAIERQLDELVCRVGDYLGARRIRRPPGQGREAEPTQTPMGQAADAGVGKAAEQAAEAAMNSTAGDGAATPPVPGSTPATQGAMPPSRGTSLLARSGLDIKVMNNRDFYEGMSLLDFLKHTGRHARLGEMLARDSVKTRFPPPLGTSTGPNAGGMSFTELTYQLLQAYDFTVLNSRADVGHCTVQLGGSDQMGNIMAGVDLIRRKAAMLGHEERMKAQQQEKGKGKEQNKEQGKEHPVRHAFALTTPLLTTSTGEKLGKSAGNAVFLSPSLVSAYDLYQYLLRTPDADVRGLLQRLTFLDEESVKERLTKGGKDGEEGGEIEGIQPPARRRLQDVLAEEVTRMTRGEEALSVAKKTTFLLHRLLPSFTSASTLSSYSATSRPQLWDELYLISQHEPASLPRSSHRIRRMDLDPGHLNDGATNPVGIDFLTLFSHTTNLCTAKGPARAILAGGSAGPLYMNGQPLGPWDKRQVAKVGVKEKNVVWLPGAGGEGKERAMIWLRRGKRDCRVLLWEGNTGESKPGERSKQDEQEREEQ